MSRRTNSKRFTVTLTEQGYEDLKRMAEQEGNETAPLAAFFIEREIAEFRKRDKSSLNQLINFVRDLLGKEDCNVPSLSALAKLINVGEEELKGLLQSLDSLEMLTGAMRSLIKSRDFDSYSIAELSEMLGCDCQVLDEFVDGLNRENKEGKRRAET